MSGWRPGTGEPVARWWEGVTVTEDMTFGAAAEGVRDLGGEVSVVRSPGGPGRVRFRHALLPHQCMFWRSSRELEREGLRWRAPAVAVEWLAELLEVLWRRERAARDEADRRSGAGSGVAR